MLIKYSPQRVDVQYKIVKKSIYVKTPINVFKVDFSSLENGELVPPLDFIPFAKKIDGELTVTIHQPIDKDGNLLPVFGEFDTSTCENVEFIWKTQEEIDQEESKPSENELIKQEQEMLAMAVMELSTFMLNGGK